MIRTLSSKETSYVSGSGQATASEGPITSQNRLDSANDSLTEMLDDPGVATAMSGTGCVLGVGSIILTDGAISVLDGAATATACFQFGYDLAGLFDGASDDMPTLDAHITDPLYDSNNYAGPDAGTSGNC